MTERLFIPDADEAEWIAKLTKRKHPADRAERMKINEEHNNKKSRKYAKTMDTQGIKENLDANTYTVSTIH